MKRLILVVAVLLSALFIFSPKASACGHEGMFVGLGYTQLFMYTPENQYNVVPPEKISFGPGYGANLTVGYDFKGSRWGIQMPFEYARLRVNSNEWANSLQASIEGILRVVQWDSGVDFHLVGGAGWAYLSEGANYNFSQSNGFTVGIGPGMSFFFAMTEHISAALAVEMPFRMVHYFTGRLSAGGTTALDIPLRLSMQVGF